MSFTKGMDVAIVGMAFRFPGADHKDTFWRNLAERRSSVVEVPPSRWEWRPIWGDPKLEPGKTHSKWAGFIDDVDAFDHEFFGLLPKVVQSMDPQQRIMLELAWASLEDAGIQPSSLQGRDVGVFVGVTHHDYKELLAAARARIEPYHYTGTATVVVPNRISHMFGLRGPSLPVDTACSSTLNAIHLAIQSMENGECRMALAGGVSLILNPARHVSVSKMGTLSPTGSCKTLDERADGYVRGEGAGMFVLKPLDAALADGDPIHGIIRGSAVNHCGKTHTLSYPNAEAQADVIVAAHLRAGVPIDSVNFVELHGTGTAKGDPIEFAGLQQAFDRLADLQGVGLAPAYCGLSSAKTNIGHLEAAAGMAGVAKVLLAFQHRQLPGFHDFRALNPRVRIEDTPFRILDRTVAWEPVQDGAPLRAGVSAFGFGGTNAHLVLEAPPPPATPRKRRAAAGPQLFALSARTPGALRRRARDLLQWVQAHADTFAPGDLSRALLLERDHMPLRIAFVADDLAQLTDALAHAAEAEAPLFVQPDDAQLEALAAESSALLARLPGPRARRRRDALDVLAQLFRNGAAIDWSALFPEPPSRRLRLPVYAFERHRFWVPESEPGDGAPQAKALGLQAPRLHPLLHHHALMADACRFVSRFDGSEFFLADHTIRGKRTLPGVAYLEMVRAAAMQAHAPDGADGHEVLLGNIVWLRPLTAEGRCVEGRWVQDRPVAVQIVLEPLASHDGTSPRHAFQVLTREGERPGELLCKGVVCLQPRAHSALPPLERLRSGATRLQCEAEQLYAGFDAQGLAYGPAHRLVRTLWAGSDYGLAALDAPPGTDASAFVLHPGVADAALQAAAAFLGNGHAHAAVPFALESVRILRAPVGALHAHIRRTGDGRCDVDLLDADADDALCAAFHGLTLRPLPTVGGTDADRALDLHADSVHATAHRAAADAPPPVTVLPPTTALQVPDSLADTLYIAAWSARPARPQPGGIASLVLVGPADELNRIEPLLRSSPQFAATRFARIVVHAGGEPPQDGTIAVRAGVAEDYAAAVAALSAGGIGLSHMLLVPAPAAAAEAADRLSASAAHVFALTKASMRGARSLRMVHLVPAGDGHVEHLALGGLFKSLRIEKPSCSGRVVQGLDGSPDADPHRFAEAVADELLCTDDAVDVRHRNGVREVRGFDRFDSATVADAAADGAAGGVDSPALAGFRDGGTYLITGGLGGIGRIVARHLCRHYRAHVYLTGRSAPGDAQTAALADIAAPGGSATYLSCDVSDREDVRRAIAAVHADGRRLDGVLHSAGVIEDNFILRKQPEEFARVIAPKTLGTWHLDAETADEPLSMFVLFSSVAGALGNVGQCDYAYGNAFEDAFAHAREAMRARGERSGRSVSINWPFWQNGGMRLGDVEIEAVRRAFGIVPLQDAPGLDALEFSLRQPLPQLLVMPGDSARVCEVIGATAAPAGIAAPADANVNADPAEVSTYLAETFAQQLDMTTGFEPDRPFRDYGVDSVVMIELITLLEKRFDTLPKTLLFEYPTLAELAGYFAEHHAAHFVSRPKAGASHAAPAQTTLVARPARESALPVQRRSGTTSQPEPIAIVGIAGRYPQAETLEAFWDNLCTGRDCIEDIPADRPDVARQFLFQPGEPVQGFSYARWGGFIRDVDRFDAAFFNISPKEAEILDPNERLFLEVAAHAIEDAGHTADTLAASSGRPDAVGVYAGVMWGDYQLHGVDRPRETWVTPHSCYWAIANRVSYQFNFSGPSLAIDTACSSSLTAIHLACQALRQGEIEAAIAGASNLSLHPNKFNLLADMHFLSTDGRCRAFGEGGDGYVPGEGVGAVVLKPLSSARRDGDHVYGVILGSAINHGGKASGFTVPNPKRQTTLIRDALQQAGVDPRHVSYIEAHGTGTSLGDPIEISGLTRAFEQPERQYCAIGSVKANIGHLEAASGVAGLTKVLLQMRHRMLAPSIHSQTLNPFIDFAATPFRVQRELQAWDRPTLVIEGQRVELPRLAGISSFGAGGANGHLIVEEYIEQPRHDDDGSPVAIVLSARRETALGEMASRLADHLQAHPEIPLRDAAYTLQVGRQGFEFRLALVVTRRDALVAALRAFAATGTLGSNAWRGHRDGARRDPEVAARLEAAKAHMPEWLALGDLQALSRAWVDGLAVEWHRLHAPGSRRRMPLPGYAYQRQRHWVPEAAEMAGSIIPGTAGRIAGGVSALHPLIDANVSTLDAQAFAKTFRAGEPVLDEHRLGDNRILPGVAVLEMALQAARLSSPAAQVTSLRRVRWQRPVAVADAPVPVHMTLQPEGEHAVFELSIDGTGTTAAQGEIRYAWPAGHTPAPLPRLDLAAIRSRCPHRIERSDIDAAFAAMGFVFGPGFRLLAGIDHNADEALGELVMAGRDAGTGAFTLPPGLLDSALRASLAVGGLNDSSDLRVPVELDAIDILGPLEPRMFVHARRVRAEAGEAMHDLDLCDADGQVRVRLRGLASRAAPQLALAMRRAKATTAIASTQATATVASAAVASTAVASAAAGASATPQAIALSLLRRLLAEATRLPEAQIDEHAPLENYGIDSVMITALNRGLEQRLGEIPKTLFFEHQELSGIAGHLAEQHAAELSAIAGEFAAAAMPAGVPAAPAAAASPVHAADTAAPQTGPAQSLHAGVAHYLRGLVAETTGLPIADVDPAVELENFGIDSTMIVKLTAGIERVFGAVSKTLFFEYQRLDELAGHLIEHHPKAAAGFATSVPDPQHATAAPPAAQAQPAAAAAPASPVAAQPPAPVMAAKRRTQRFAGASRHGDDIAVIGLSGHYPGAEDLHGFWRNLAAGVDGISEIPASRWDHARIFHPDRSHKGTAYAKWGGFLDRIDHFDARFFNISAREAEIMDPQERLFLQTAWECVEDACHTRQSLRNARVGVFVGVAWPYYAQFDVSDEQLQSGRPSTTFASIANRVSYFMNFDGPSMAVDTMCSSSLTAIHLAIAAIHDGDCDQAIAGGVNLITHRNKYLQLSSGQFLSSDGRCRAFGDGGDGYVPGEGVGAVLLKPLQQALEDGDHIYGVIKATALNHGGKTNGYTVPSRPAQTAVISEALRRSGWDPRTIDYVEAHGTGTSLGDPIEIAGLSRAFAEAGSAHAGTAPATIAPQGCRIGSVKSNIGHLESAAAIAGLTKILLQFRHDAIPPSLHAATPNRNIDFANSPFRVVQSQERWERPDDGHPRRAGLSSFGAGGANAHCLIEDYRLSRPSSRSGRPALFVLSADRSERLDRQVDRVIAFLERGGDPDVGLDIATLAHASQVGREAMGERLAVVASSIDELLAALRAHRDGLDDARVFRGSLRERGDNIDAIMDDAEKDALSLRLIASGQLDKLARAWTSMLDIDWSRCAAALYPDGRPRRMPFPAMPFLGERHWVEERVVSNGGALAPHPLIDDNLSTLSAQVYRKRFDGSEFCLRDHVVRTDRERRILPGAAYLEIARAAGDLAVADAQLRVAGIRNLMWIQPFEISGAPDALTLRLEQGSGHLEFEIARDSDGVGCVEGELVLRNADDALADEHLDLAALLARATPLEDNAGEIYDGFLRAGYLFGPSFRVTQARYHLAEGALCRLRLPEHLRGELGRYGLHPSLLDATLRAGLAVEAEAGLPPIPIVPFALDMLDYRHPLPSECYVYATRSSDALALPAPHIEGHATDVSAYKYDLVVVDADGRVLAKLHGFAGRPLQRAAASPSRSIGYYGYTWAPAPLSAGLEAAAGQTVLLLSGSNTLAEALARQLPAGSRLVFAPLAGSQPQEATDDAGFERVDAFDPFDPDSAARLFASLNARDLHPQQIVYCDDSAGEDALADAPACPDALHRGIQAVRRVFVASERTMPGAATRLLYVFRDAGSSLPHHEAVSGYARSMLSVNHRFELATLRDDREGTDDRAQAIADELGVNAAFGGNEIARRGGQRLRRTLREYDPSATGFAELPLREGGTYLITGGAGKLGLQLASRFAERIGRVALVLTGRSAEPSAEAAETIAALCASGARVHYRRADIADPAGVSALIAGTLDAFGRLDGIIHCAGVASDLPITDLDDRAFDAMLSPKIDGLIRLDHAMAGLSLDFFACFSSVSALLGDLGGGAYAVGNRFMDAFMRRREDMRAQGHRQGRSLSINWPLWATGGMEIEGDNASMFGFSGMHALSEEEGLDAFERILRGREDGVFVSVGDPQRIARTLRLDAPEAPARAPQSAIDASTAAPASTLAKTAERSRPAPVAAPVPPQRSAPGRQGAHPLQSFTETLIKQRMSAISKTPVDRIDSGASFEQSGFDSVLLLELHAALKHDFDGLPKTALFEYDTIERLAGHLVARYGAQLRALAGDDATATTPADAGADASAHAPADTAATAPASRPAAARASAPAIAAPPALPLGKRAPAAAAAAASGQAIAIVGLAGEFPDSPDLARFWQNVRNARTCTGPIPDARGFAQQVRGAHTRTGQRIADAGGFISDVDLFDPVLFRMSKAEADTADPQLRVLLRTAWRAVEDAAYTPETLSERRVGVFVGAMNEDFTWITAERQAITERYVGPGSVASELANRLSFLMNLRGPSLTLSTACSAALTALHLARRAILDGDCEAALVGGINLSLHPVKYRLLDDMKVLSPDGRERAFDDAANGLVPSEGACVVVLKRLDLAIADGDHIHGVIRASRISHSGTGAGQFIPNLRAMEDTVAECIEEAGVAASEIGYIECHGTGTELGDPIELKALANALCRDGEPVGTCAIGSKANFGHMEAASGLASLAKVLLCMRHGEIAPCAHLKRVNSSFDHVGSPLRFPQDVEAWTENADGHRIAGINAFGMGGSNAFVLLQSHAAVPAMPAVDHASPAIISLSARSHEALRAYARDVAAHARTHVAQAGPVPLADWAYVSQTGRQGWRHRLALVVQDAQVLAARIDAWLENPEQRLPGLHTGDTQSPAAADTQRLLSGDAGDGFVASLIEQAAWDRVAELWARGARIDWPALHRGQQRRRLPFPGVPFELQRCGLDQAFGPPDLVVARHAADSALPVLQDVAARTATEAGLPAEGDTRGSEWYRLDAIAIDAIKTTADGAAGSDDALRSFWSERLGASTETAMELASALPLEVGADGDTPLPAHCVTELVDSSLLHTLQTFSQRHAIAIETLVAAAWAVLVNRHTKARCSQFGLFGAAPRSGAPDLLPVRVRTVGKLRMLDWLRSLQDELLRQHHLAPAPIERIGEWVEQSPLFDSLVAFDSDPARSQIHGRQAAGADTQSPSPSPSPAPPHDSHPSPRVELVTLATTDTLELTLIYRARTPSDEQAGALLEQFIVLLEGIVTNPDKMPSALGMRTRAESRERFWKTMDATTQ